MGVVVVLVLGDSFSAAFTPGCTALRTKRDKVAMLMVG